MPSEPKSETPRAFRPNPGFEQKAVPILVRWLLIILTFHLLAYSGVGASALRMVSQITYVFVVSNLLLMMLPRRYFAGALTNAMTWADFAYVSVALYAVREPGAYYEWALIAALAALAATRKLKPVLIGLAAVLAGYSVTSRIVAGHFAISRDTGDFLRSAILFSVVLLYFYVLVLLERNAKLFEIVLRGKQEWERTADAMSELILLLNPDGTIRRVNRAFAEKLGYEPPQLIGLKFSEMLDGRAAPDPDSPFARMLANRSIIVDRYTHAALAHSAETLAIPVFEESVLTGGIYVIRPWEPASESFAASVSHAAH